MDKELIHILANIVDGMKRLESAILADAPDDVAYYVDEAKQRRQRAEKILMARIEKDTP